MKPNVSVIIPSFNRARLLNETIPSYLQDEVLELIIVDDCSTDNTAEVVEQMMATEPRIRYLRKTKNERQAAAKNDGIKLAQGEFIYFGDDDSFIIPGTIKMLMETLLENNADITAAKAIYMDEHEVSQNWPQIVARRRIFGKQLLSANRFHIDFSTSVEKPTELKVAQACILTKTALAKSVMFDPLSYMGSGYREETDFIVRAIGHGARLFYNSDAVQINLPRIQTAGGSRSSNRLKYEMTTISNNWNFLTKNHKILVDHYEVSWPAWLMQLSFIIDRIPYLAMALSQTIFPGLYSWLKRTKARLRP